MFMRLHGMDAQSCNECHNIVRGRARPPTLGFAGVGGIAQNAMPLCTLIDGSDSWETIKYNRVNFTPHPNLPFNRKGGRFSMRDFDRDAMQFHFGIQPVEVVGEGVDEDFDGYVNEITVGEMTALHIFGVCNPRPFFQPGKDASEQQELEEGALLCSQGGCFYCHRPILITEDNLLPLAFPEVAEVPEALEGAKESE